MKCGDVTIVTLGLQPRLKHEFKEVGLEEMLSSTTSHYVFLCNYHAINGLQNGHML
jgi:hypothetical protein